jgi:hypothetical protein
MKPGLGLHVDTGWYRKVVWLTELVRWLGLVYLAFLGYQWTLRVYWANRPLEVVVELFIWLYTGVIYAVLIPFVFLRLERRWGKMVPMQLLMYVAWLAMASLWVYLFLPSGEYEPHLLTWLSRVAMTCWPVFPSLYKVLKESFVRLAE